MNKFIKTIIGVSCLTVSSFGTLKEDIEHLNPGWYSKLVRCVCMYDSHKSFQEDAFLILLELSDRNATYMFESEDFDSKDSLITAIKRKLKEGDTFEKDLKNAENYRNFIEGLGWESYKQLVDIVAHYRPENLQDFFNFIKKHQFIKENLQLFDLEDCFISSNALAQSISKNWCKDENNLFIQDVNDVLKAEILKSFEIIEESDLSLLNGKMAEITKTTEGGEKVINSEDAQYLKINLKEVKELKNAIETSNVDNFKTAIKNPAITVEFLKKLRRAFWTAWKLELYNIVDDKITGEKLSSVIEWVYGTMQLENKRENFKIKDLLKVLNEAQKEKNLYEILVRQYRIFNENMPEINNTTRAYNFIDNDDFFNYIYREIIKEMNEDEKNELQKYIKILSSSKIIDENMQCFTMFNSSYDTFSKAFSVVCCIGQYKDAIKKYEKVYKVEEEIKMIWDEYVKIDWIKKLKEIIYNNMRQIPFDIMNYMEYVEDNFLESSFVVFNEKGLTDTLWGLKKLIYEGNEWLVSIKEALGDHSSKIYDNITFDSPAFNEQE